MSETCPYCKRQSGLREIIYGMPAEPLDEERFYVGGCCVSPLSPTWKCIECGWEGWSLNSSGGQRINGINCPICNETGKFQFLDGRASDLETLSRDVFIIETTYGELKPNICCSICGWKTYVINTYTY